MNRSIILALSILLLGIGVGWLITRDAVEANSEVADNDHKKSAGESNHAAISRLPENLGPRVKKNSLLEDLLSIRNERIISFSSDEAYRKAIALLEGSDFKILGKLNRFRSIRISGKDLSSLDDLLDEDATIASNFVVSIPLVPDPETGNAGVAFGSGALEFLNITGDNSKWGEGVKIAIIDTGVAPHIALPDGIQKIVVDGVAEGELHGHGTAVASLIVGQHSRVPGIAPSAPILSIQVADSTGSSNSFLLAKGIIAAVDNGAQVINISMGSYGDSGLVREAISYAQSAGSVIVASAGNDGFNFAANPAAYAGVISVGAIDATGAHMSFSNQSADLSLTAPGVGPTAAWPGDQSISFTGTSASAPFVSGTLAAIISESPYPITGAQAGEILLNYTNDAGDYGNDTSYGSGYLDVGRVMERDTPGIVDLAVTSYNYELNSIGAFGNGLQIGIENQGTESVQGGQLTVNVDGGSYPVNLPTLSVNERYLATLPVGQSTLNDTGSLPVSSSITFSTETTDAQPSNNRRTEIITLPSSSIDGP